MTQARSFPENLSDAPKELRVDETFGFFPGAVVAAAVLSLVACFVAFIRNEGLTVTELEFACGALVAILVFGGWEVFRRTRPTTIILMNGELGLYRKGKLDKVATFGQVSHFRLNIVNSMREYMLFGIVGFGGFLGGVAMFGTNQLDTALWMVAGGIGGILAFASAIYARGMCFHYDVPKGNGTERIVLRKAKLRKIGWPGA